MKRMSIKDRVGRGWMIMAAFVALAALTGHANALRAAEVNTGYFGNVAIMGYDPVAYFTMKDAVKGSKEHTHEWLGATWQFANEEHREAFSASPIRYAPQYGGLCTVGVAYGEVTREIDPEAWSIINGKLYLNYAKSVTREFEEDTADLIAKADKNWPQVKARLAE